MNFSLKVFGVGALSFTCSVIFLNAISAASFPYQLLFFILLLAIVVCIVAFASLLFATAIQVIGLIGASVMQLFS